MPLTVQRVGYGREPKLNTLVYGMAGVGKTTFAAQAQDHPVLSPVLFADLEGGLLSVSGRKDIDAVQIRSSSEMDELFWLLRNGQDGFDRFNTVVIDSGTNLANRILEEWVATNQERDAKKNKNRKGQTLDDVQLEDYGKMTAHVRRLMTWYRDLPINLIVTALARFEYAANADQRTAAPTMVSPDFTAKLSGSVTGMMDHVWYFWADEDGRHMLTQEQGVYRAKTRGEYFAPALGFTVDEPNLSSIYQLLCDTEGSDFEMVDSYDQHAAESAYDGVDYDDPNDEVEADDADDADQDDRMNLNESGPADGSDDQTADPEPETVEPYTTAEEDAILERIGVATLPAVATGRKRKR